MTSKSEAMWILSPSFSYLIPRAKHANMLENLDAFECQIASSPTATRGVIKLTSHLQYINGTATTREKIPNERRASILRICLAATGSVNEDVIETAICDGNDKYQAWQLKVIEELPQHLDDEYGGH